MSEFASAGLTAGQLNAIVKKLGGHEGALRFLRDELLVSEPTTCSQTQSKEGGLICFSVTSDGTTGEDWITRLESKGFHIGDCVKQVLRSSDFKPTSGVATTVAVLRSILFEDKTRITRMIRAEADKRNFSTPNVELACIIRDKFSDREIEQMGLRFVVVMHEPVSDPDGATHLLSVNPNGWLNAFFGMPDDKWSSGIDFGFAFVVSPVNPSS